MRTVTFVDRLSLDFEGNVSQNAIFLGDVDNDDRIEFIVGNSSGNLSVFKGKSSKPWKTCSDLGHITAIGVGDILNLQRNVLVVVSSDGWCYLFDWSNLSIKPGESKLECTYKQRLPPNVKEIIIADVNGNGFVELLLALTDRVIRTYRWHHTGEFYSQKLDGKLVPLNKWDFAFQIGSVSLNQNELGHPMVLVSQPGGSFLKIRCKMMDDKRNFALEDDEDREVLLDMSLDNEPLIVDSIRNLNVSSEIIGNLSRQKHVEDVKVPSTNSYAIATLDGTVMIVQDEKIKHRIKINNQLFCLNKLDITEDQRDELIVSSWDGNTYIISQEGQCVEFHFGESISTFYTGYYTIDDQKVPALVYVTFSNKIYVYYNVSLSRGLSLKTLRHNEEILSCLKELKVDVEDSIQFKNLIERTLYNYGKEESNQE